MSVASALQYCTVLSRMTCLPNVDWSILPDPIFDEIMLIIGRESLECLDICKQVCQAWNRGIQRNLWDSPSKKWGSVIERRIMKSCCGPKNFPSDEKLAYVKLLGDNDKN